MVVAGIHCSACHQDYINLLFRAAPPSPGAGQPERTSPQPRRSALFIPTYQARCRKVASLAAHYRVARSQQT